jgi:hypothetical protein
MSSSQFPHLVADTHSEGCIALIGAGPSGLAAARALTRLGISFQGFEAHTGVGGLWDIANPRSAVYESAHPVSSKRRTEFSEFPMAEHLADYPSHRDMLAYLREYAQHFDLTRHFQFGVLVRRIEPMGERPDSLWRVTVDAGDGPKAAIYKGVIIATGTLAEPRMPRFEGRFTGELMHASSYKHPRQLDGKRVLVIGGGNSACDIAVDAVGRAQYADLSVRRGYHFLPRYLFGQPSDTWELRWPLPAMLRWRLERWVLRRYGGNPQRFGFPAPTHRLYESTPVVNPAILHHLGQGDLHVRPDIDRFENQTAHFKDGTQRAYDLVIAATGYKLHYPFLRPELLNWQGVAPRLHLNTFSKHYQRLSVLGLFDGHGVTWQDRLLQAELVACYLAAQDQRPERAKNLEARIKGSRPNLAGGLRFLKQDRLAHHVHAPTFRRALKQALKSLV